MLKLISMAVVVALACSGCSRALNSQIGMRTDKPIKIRDIPTNDLISLCEKGVTERGQRLSGDEGPNIDMCLYLGRQYATGGTFYRNDVSKDIPQSLYYFDKACGLGSAKGCEAAKGMREVTGST